MTLAILSDLHCGQPVGRWSRTRRLTGRHDKTHFDRARRLIASINDHPEVERCILLGDGVDRSMGRECGELREILEMIDVPWDCLVGNHCVTSVAKLGLGYSSRGHARVRSAITSAGGRIDYPYVVECDGYRLICLDSSAHNESGTLFARGRIGSEQIAFLASQLSVQVPTIVALHHYPARVDPTLAISDADDLMAVCTRGHVTIINGHRHRAGVYPATRRRCRIIASCQSVESMRWRLLEPVSGEWEWVGV